MPEERAIELPPFFDEHARKAAACPRYLHGRILAESTALQWSGLCARRLLCHRLVDRVPPRFVGTQSHLFAERTRLNGPRRPLRSGHYLIAFRVIRAFSCCCEDPRPNDRGSISSVCGWRSAGRQRLSPMAGPLCAALSVSTRGGSIPRACHSRAVDLLRPRRLSGVPGARAWRDLGDTSNRAR
jgi:hypothetical protein